MNGAPFTATDYRLFVSTSSSPPTNTHSTGHCLDIAAKNSSFNEYLQSTNPADSLNCTSNISDRFYANKESVINPGANASTDKLIS